MHGLVTFQKYQQISKIKLNMYSVRHKSMFILILLLYYWQLVWARQLSPYSDLQRAGRFGMECRWGRDFPAVQTGSGARPPSGSTPGVKCGWSLLLTTHHLLVPRSWKSRAIPLPTIWATPGLLRDHFTFTLLDKISASKGHHQENIYKI